MTSHTTEYVLFATAKTTNKANVELKPEFPGTDMSGAMHFGQCDSKYNSFVLTVDPPVEIEEKVENTC